MFSASDDRKQNIDYIQLHHPGSHGALLKMASVEYTNNLMSDTSVMRALCQYHHQYLQSPEYF
jgi:hypothetical protein